MHTRRCIIILLHIFEEDSKIRLRKPVERSNVSEWNGSTRFEHYKMLNDHHHIVHNGELCAVSSVYVSLGLYAFHIWPITSNILFILLTLVYFILLLLNYYNIRNVFWLWSSLRLLVWMAMLYGSAWQWLCIHSPFPILSVY